MWSLPLPIQTDADDHMMADDPMVDDPMVDDHMVDDHYVLLDDMYAKGGGYPSKGYEVVYKGKHEGDSLFSLDLFLLLLSPVWICCETMLG
jgi:hypothetical protein